METVLFLGCLYLNLALCVSTNEKLYVSITGCRVVKTKGSVLPDSLVVQLTTEMNQTFRHPVRICSACMTEIPIHITKENAGGLPNTFRLMENEGHYTGRNVVYRLMFNGDSLVNVNGFFERDGWSMMVESYADGHFIRRVQSAHGDVIASHFSDNLNVADTEYLPIPNMSRVIRHKRQNQLYEIELFIAIEYSFYKEWLDHHVSPLTNTSVILYDIVHHFVMLMNGVTARFNAIRGTGYFVDILLTGIYIAQSPTDSFWSENIKQESLPRAVISEESLKLFADWLKRNSDMTSHHDHAFVFTAYDLMSRENRKTLGLGYKQSMCTEKSVSMIEHHGNIAYTSFIAAHELAHSLGAKHDGFPATVKYGDISHTCTSGGGYIMSAKATKSPDDDKRSWDFSKCSLLYFDFFIDHLNAKRSNCLLWSAARNASPAILSHISHVYSPDEQCEHANGEGSFMHRELFSTRFENFCRSMPCSDPYDSDQVLNTLSSEGTKCGTGKVCHLGQCITDEQMLVCPEPESSDDTCLFGDQPGVVKDGKTCAELISGADKAFMCYTYQHHCCRTCAKYERHFASGELWDMCAYGDRKAGCTISDCNAQQCCETCAVHDGILTECTQLTAPPHGSIVYNTKARHHGTIATFSCKHGYQLHGARQSHCSENGTWSHPPPICFRGCLAPVTSLYIELTPNDITFGVDSVITARCLHGLQLIGDATLRCYENSTWSNEPRCELGLTSGSTLYAKENTEPNTVIQTLKSGNAHAHYELLYRSHSCIGVTQTGLVFAEADSLDYETVQIVTLVVEATLIINPRIRATHRLTVIIEDDNEYEPKFLKDHQCCSVIPPPSLDISIGVIARMSAKDYDGSGNSITYSFRENTEITEVFQIDEKSGEIIFVESSYCRDPVKTKFNMEVIATDSGSPVRTGTCKVQVVIGHGCNRSSFVLPGRTAVAIFLLTFVLYVPLFSS